MRDLIGFIPFFNEMVAHIMGYDTPTLRIKKMKESKREKRWNGL